MYLSFIMIALFSCEKEKNELSINVNIDNQLVGIWCDTIALQPQGLIVYQLTIDNKAEIVSNVTMYGAYPGQTLQDVASWSESHGLLEQNKDSLFVRTDKFVWWDRFYRKPPVTENRDGNIRGFWCTYSIRNDSLITSYLTFPADAPVMMSMVYIKGR
jgi:hypothetical protein